MTTREWADARQNKRTAYREYMQAQRQYEILTKEFLKKLTKAKNDKIISVRDLNIMRMRLQKNMLLEEVARHFYVTRERIRMIEESVIERLIEL